MAPRPDETPQADQFSPVGVTVTPTGQVLTPEVDLLAGADATPPDERKIRWLREADLAVAAQLFAYLSSGGTVLELDAVDPDTGGNQDIAQLLLAAIAGNIAEAVVGGIFGGTLFGRKIIDNTGASDFISQAGVTGGGSQGTGKQLAFGTSNYHFNASRLSDVVNITHGLKNQNGTNRTPSAVIVTPAGGTTIENQIITPSVGAYGVTLVPTWARVDTGVAIGPGDIPFAWMAIG